MVSEKTTSHREMESFHTSYDNYTHYHRSDKENRDRLTEDEISKPYRSDNLETIIELEL